MKKYNPLKLIRTGLAAICKAKPTVTARERSPIDSCQIFITAVHQHLLGVSSQIAELISPPTSRSNTASRSIGDPHRAYRRHIIAIGTVFMLIVGVMGAAPQSALAARGFAFTPLAFLGDGVPNGGEFVFDFESYAINNRGEVAFGADLAVEGTPLGEGIFLFRQGQSTELARTGDPAPGTETTYGPQFNGPIALNEVGDAAYTFPLEPVGLNLQIGAGVFRFLSMTGTVTPVFVPGETPAPGGGVFAGASIRTSLNNRGDLAFAGVVTDADIEPGPPGVDSEGLGVGVFVQDRFGQLVSVVRPGDAAPGDEVFDFAQNPVINDRRDVAFGGHVADQECIELGTTQEQQIFCAESVFVKDAVTGVIRSIAQQGDPAPGGGTYRLAFGPVINNRGDILFIGDLTPAPSFGERLGVFLHSQGSTVPVARPGDALPGGGTLVTASFFIATYDLNERGDVIFSASVDTDGDMVSDATGLFRWSRGSLQLVAQTGTVIPGVGTIAQLLPPDVIPIFPDFFPWPWFGIASNERGQIVFTAALEDGRGVLLLATPAPM